MSRSSSRGGVPPPFALSTETLNGVLVVHVSGELDLGHADRLAAALEAEPTGEEGGRRVAIDMHEVAFIDSTGVRALLQAKRRTEDAGGVLALVAPSAAVLRVLQLSELTDALNVIDAVDAEEMARLQGP
jgi:anti-anti-sigma factor